MQASVFRLPFMAGSPWRRFFYWAARAIALLAVRMAYADLRSGGPFWTDPGCSEFRARFAPERCTCRWHGAAVEKQMWCIRDGWRKGTEDRDRESTLVPLEARP